MEPYIAYLINNELPANEVHTKQIQRRARAYTIINKQLYRRSVGGIYQRCVDPEDGRRLLQDIHQGECGHHVSSRAIVSKAMRYGFLWLTALEDAEQLIRTCNGCQRFRTQKHTPAVALKTIPITWPFAVWGLYMVGPSKTARSGMTHLLVAVDNFTKWIEVKPIKKLDGSTAATFIKDIIVRYGYPHNIITDNRTDFVKGAFARFCGNKGIRLDVASVAHPQSNGQAERANDLILAGIKPRLVEPLERSPGCWLDELPVVLWSIRTITNRSTGYTPFFLVYCAEAVLPADIEHDSPRVALYTEADAKEAREDGVDLVEEARELALSRSAINQQNLRRYHSRRIRPLAFREGDLVLQLVQDTKGRHKLSPPWEGPFIISKALRNNAYYLIALREPGPRRNDTAGEETEHTWNAELLRPFYT